MIFWAGLLGLGWAAVEPTERLPACGESAAFVLLTRRGYSVRIAELRKRTEEIAQNRNERVISCRDLTALLDTYGMKADALRVDPAQLRRLATPAILFIPPDRLGRR